MSDIEQALKDIEEDFHISNEDRLMLIDMLVCTAAALKSGKLWFNQPGLEHNSQFVEFAERIAKKFSNMPVAQEN